MQTEGNIFEWFCIILNSSGGMVTGWQTIETPLLFSSSGNLQTGWQQSVVPSFDSKWALQTGWETN